MNRFLRLETILFILFSLFFTLSVEANESGSKRYRDSFSNAPEHEEPVGDGKDNNDDRGTKGGKTGKKKKKKVDISIPPGAGNEGSLIITIEAKSAQLTSFSNNGFSEPGAPVILDPDSLSPISSDRSLFDQARGEFIGEGGKVFVDENGLVLGEFDPEIGQMSDAFFAGASRVAKGSEVLEDGGYKLALTGALQMHPATSVASPFITPHIMAHGSPIHVHVAASTYVSTVWRVGAWTGSKLVKAHAATWGLGSPEFYAVLDAAPTPAIADGWTGLSFSTNPNGDGVGWGAVELTVGAAATAIGGGAIIVGFRKPIMRLIRRLRGLEEVDGVTPPVSPAPLSNGTTPPPQPPPTNHWQGPNPLGEDVTPLQDLAQQGYYRRPRSPNAPVTPLMREARDTAQGIADQLLELPLELKHGDKVVAEVVDPDTGELLVHFIDNDGLHVTIPFKDGAFDSARKEIGDLDDPMGYFYDLALPGGEFNPRSIGLSGNFYGDVAEIMYRVLGFERMYVGHGVGHIRRAGL